MKAIYTLKLFFLCLFPCAGLILFFVWNGGPPSPIYFQVAATLFIVGLTSFLVWFTHSITNLCTVANLKK
jgi:hypothetical protein